MKFNLADKEMRNNKPNQKDAHVTSTKARNFFLLIMRKPMVDFDNLTVLLEAARSKY